MPKISEFTEAAADTGDFAYGVIGGNSRKTQFGAIPQSNKSVSNAKLADMQRYTLKGNNTADTGSPTDIALADLSEKTTLVNSDMFLILDTGDSPGFRQVQRLNFAGPTQADMVLYRHPSSAVASAASATYAFPGSALTASLISIYPALYTGRKLRFARWLLAWNPNTVSVPGTSTGIQLIHAESGPTNITQIAEFTRTGTTPVTDAVDVTTSLQALIDAGANKFLGHQMKGNGTDTSLVYLSIIELIWK